MTFLQILRPIYVPLVIFLIHIIDRLCKLYTSQLMVNYAGDVQKFWQKNMIPQDECPLWIYYNAIHPVDS